MQQFFAEKFFLGDEIPFTIMITTIFIGNLSCIAGGPGMLLHINGSQYGDYDNLVNNSHLVGDFVEIQRTGDNAIQLLTENDTYIVVNREPNNLVVLISLERDRYFGMTTGLLGNWSDNVEDDFYLPNGTNLGYPLTDKQIHFDFGESCKYSLFNHQISTIFAIIKHGFELVVIVVNE